MRLTFLGTGTSQGVPMIGCHCPVCQSHDPRDKRFRSSVWIQDTNLSVLIDSTPDLRSQALRANMNQLDAVVYTHCHNDHLIGFDDLRRYCDQRAEPMPVYCSEETQARLQQVFSYAFPPHALYQNYVRAIAHVFTGPFQIGSLRLIPVQVPHGKTLTHGFIIEKEGKRLAAYIPDCAEIPDSTAEILKDLPLLILDGLRDKPHPTHMTIAQAIDAGQRARAKKIYLTHLTHDISHAEKQKTLPPNVFLAYDGLSLDLTLE
jgi:phosphoribosyl 1,2-cyclic phosphate phosphodiesterase